MANTSRAVCAEEGSVDLVELRDGLVKAQRQRWTLNVIDRMPAGN